MTQKADTLKASVPGEISQSTVHWRIPILAFGLMALVLGAGRGSVGNGRPPLHEPVGGEGCACLGGE